jgi:hypothetical protein
MYLRRFEMEWIVGNLWVWGSLAVFFSLLWGFYGVVEEKTHELKCPVCSFIKLIGVFVSEFLGSLAGWGCLYLFVVRLYNLHKDASTAFDISLIILAAICITGWSCRLNELVGKIKGLPARE